MSTRILTAFFTIVLFGLSPVSVLAELRAGTATIDITPDKPVALSGQFHLRIGRTVESPVTANVLVLESPSGGPFSFVGGIAVAVITYPMMVAVGIVMYHDLKLRKEGWDIGDRLESIGAEA